MNLEFKHLLPEDFAAESRVWIYQSSRLFSLSEALEIEDQINEFTAGWLSHGAAVQAYGNLLFGQFIILMVDERQAGVSGCSTDASVRFIKSLGERFNVDFFNRTSLAFLVKDKVQVLPMNQLKYAFENGFINADTTFFNNLVSTKKELEEQWLLPVKSTWLATKINLAPRHI